MDGEISSKRTAGLQKRNSERGGWTTKRKKEREREDGLLTEKRKGKERWTT